MTTTRAALLAGTALAVAAWAAPAAAQLQPEPAACGQRIEELERRIETAGLPERIRADLARLVRSAETFLDNGNLEGCAETLAEAERIVETAGGPAPVRQPQQAGQPRQGQQQPGRAPAGTAAPGAQIVVEQPQPQILIRQQPPLVTLRMPEPQVTVRIPEPEVIIRMPEPQVEVTMPEPEVQVEQRPPEVEVRMARPEVELEQPEPEVRFEAAEAQPRVRVERAQPRVEVQQGEPRVRFQPMAGQGQEQRQQAGGAACEPRLARLEQVAQRLDLPPELRARVEGSLQDAAARLEAGDAEACTAVLAEAEALIQGAGGPRQEQPTLAQTGEGRQGGGQAGEGMARVTGTTVAEDTERSAPGGVGLVEAPGQEVAAVEPGEEAAAAGAREIPILRLGPEEILGADVYGGGGDEVAEIEAIVRRVGEDALYAVLEVGGFLGVGEREVAVPLAEFELGPGDEIILPVAVQDNLEGLPAYDESEYEETGLED